MNTILIRRAGIIAALSFFAGCQRNGTVVESATPVRVYVVRSHELKEEIISSGAIESVDKADVAFMVPGRVVSVEVEEGTSVKQGQVLARLEAADYQHNLNIAEAQLNEVKARHVRLSHMHEVGSLTDTDFDKIDAALKQAESAAELARRQLAYTELHAPFDGWIVKHGISPGVVVSPAVPVFTVLSPAPIWANLGVAETDIDKIKVGNTAEISLSAAGGSARSGPIEAIVPQADVLSRSFTVKVRLDNPDRSLRPGNVVVGHLFTGNTHPVISVPPQVVQKHPDGSLYVWLYDRARNTAVRQLVQVAALHATEVEIASGLKPGDQVVLNVPHTLFEGAHLTVANTP